MLEPIGARVVVRAKQQEEKTKSGLFIPEAAKEIPQVGTVVAVGGGDVHPMTGQVVPLRVAVDDQVLYLKYAGTTFKDGDQELLVMAEKDILAKVVT